MAKDHQEMILSDMQDENGSVKYILRIMKDMAESTDAKTVSMSFMVSNEWMEDTLTPTKETTRTLM